MSQPTPDLGALLGDSGADAEAIEAMQLTADTLGPAIQAGLGTVTLDQIKTSDVLLVTELIDDSSSIRDAGNAPAIREGANNTPAALRDSKQANGILMSARYFNDSSQTDHGVLYPYRPLVGVPELTVDNYNPRGGTPLYDQTAITLTGVAAKMAEFELGGVSARAVTLIVTDGDDQHSRHHTAASVRQIVEGLLRTEAHIIIGMGIEDPRFPDLDFRQIFREMGIREEWILRTSSDPSEIRAAFEVFTQSAVRASQAAGAEFSRVAMGGFGV